ncbi:hypothetical protein ACLKA7_008050 [Drosophila subpalustris]
MSCCCLLRILLTICSCSGSSGSGSDILMITMAGTESHKIPFWALAKAPTKRGHRITSVNGFQSHLHVDVLVEVTPKRLVQYIRVQNYTAWDLMGQRYAALSIVDAMRYPIESGVQCVHHLLLHHLGEDVPHLYVLDRELASIWQNGHFSVGPPPPICPMWQMWLASSAVQPSI